ERPRPRPALHRPRGLGGRDQALERERGGTWERGTAPIFGLARLSSRTDSSCGPAARGTNTRRAQDGHWVTESRPSIEGSSVTRPGGSHERHRDHGDGCAGGGVEEEVIARGDDHEEDEDRIGGRDRLDERPPGKPP